MTQAAAIALILINFGHKISEPIGSEGQGLSAELLSLCDGELIIPMNAQCESLNAAVAAAIIMWELAKAEGGGAT